MDMANVKPTLQTFWRRYGKIRHGHEVFQASAQGRVALSRAIPCLVHGDEGRGFKRSGVMILSLQGAIGKGSQPFLKHHSGEKGQQERVDRMGVNIGGASYNSRLLFGAMPKKHYNVHPDFGQHIAFFCFFFKFLFGLGLFVFVVAVLLVAAIRPVAQENYQALVKCLVDDLLQLQDGFTYNDERWHVIILGLKGDLPFLAKTGNLERHWLRAPRKREGSKKNTDKKPVGVCFLCNAGTETGGPFEDFNTNAQWVQAPVTRPWLQRPLVLDLFHDPTEPQRIFRPDIWHNYHGGVGKLFAASALAECLRIVQGTSMKAKIKNLAYLLREWAAFPGNSMPHSGNFCSERISLTSYQVMPDASWSKHDDTRIYHKFLEWWLGTLESDIQCDPILVRILFAVRSINRVFSVLYKGGLWLTSAEAHEAGTLGRHWLRLYVELAEICYRSSLLRFPLVVKHHMMDHHFRDLLAGSSQTWSWNCLADSVQMDEDFIGHTARLSRRVSPVSTSLRVLERYLTKALRTWKQIRRWWDDLQCVHSNLELRDLEMDCFHSVFPSTGGPDLAWSCGARALKKRAKGPTKQRHKTTSNP